MNVLIVCSGNLGRINPFISDQAIALNNANIKTEFFPIKGKGFFGYLKNLPLLIKKIKENNYDVVHAHYGLSGMLAVMQRIVPVVVTFHGTDVNSRKNHLISLITSKLSSFNILVIDNFISKLKLRKNYSVISCGVDLDVFKIFSKEEARIKMNLDPGKKVILFASRFDNYVKNYPLAKKAVDMLSKEIPSVELMELRGYSREQICLMMNAADALLVTSFTESGPLVVKEAMACNLPIVSTEVGDVGLLLKGIQGSYITSYSAADIADKLKKVIASGKRVETRAKMSVFENKKVALKIKKVYESVASGKR